MSRDRVAGFGFQHPVRNARRLAARNLAFTHLLMTVGLILSLAIALTAVTFGIARADTIGAIVDGRDGALMLAAFLALLIAGMGGITAAITRTGSRNQRRD
jgi:hypothetical protein